MSSGLSLCLDGDNEVIMYRAHLKFSKLGLSFILLSVPLLYYSTILAHVIYRALISFLILLDERQLRKRFS